MGNDQTRRAIELAISRITQGRPKRIQPNRKLSIASVAEEAGISNASIHNRYPDLAELIRQKTNKGARERLVKQEKVLRGADLLIKELRDGLAERDADLKRIAIANLRLSAEKKALKELNALLVNENERLEGANRELLSQINSPRGQVKPIR